MIADPLTRLQCSSISDGAAAAVLGPDRDHPRDVRDARLGVVQRRAVGLPQRPRVGI